MEAKLLDTPKTRLALTASEFAARAGVSVRTLHHYDRVGLLRPGRSRSGYRLYGEADFARLQQIVTLKFVGLSLTQIRELLDHNKQTRKRKINPAEALRLQRRLLELKRNQINSAITALARVELEMASPNTESGPSLFCEILELIAMHNNTEWEKLHAQYFTEEQRADMARRADPDLAAEGTRKWTALIQEVEAAVQNDEDPASLHARSLARRWNDLCDEFLAWAAGPGSKTSKAEVKAGLSKMYSDRHNWPGTMKPPFSEAALQFIHAAQKSGASSPAAVDAAGEPVSLGKFGAFEIYPMPLFATLSVRDVAALRDWYMRALGFVVVFQTPAANGQPQLVHLRRRKYQDLLLVHAGENGSNQSPTNLTISFQTEDVDAQAEQARSVPSYGAAVIEGPVNTPWNTRDLRVTDPVGTRLVFTGHNPNADPKQVERMRKMLEGNKP
jgi:MerR family transcriptional regulator, thiopeptide resistance regulator